MCADDLREAVPPLKSIVHLVEFIGVRANGEIVEVDIRDAFSLRRQRDDAGRIHTGDKPLGREADADAAHGLTEIGGIAQKLK